MKFSFSTGVLCCAIALSSGTAFAADSLSSAEIIGLLTDHRPKEFTTKWYSDRGSVQVHGWIEGAYEVPVSAKQPFKAKASGKLTVNRGDENATVPFTFVALGTESKLWVGEVQGSASLAASHLGVLTSGSSRQTGETPADVWWQLHVLTGMPLSGEGWDVSIDKRMPSGRTVQLGNDAGDKLKVDLATGGFLQFARLYGSLARTTFQTEITRRTQPVYVPKPKPEGVDTDCVLCGVGFFSSQGVTPEESVWMENEASSWALPTAETQAPATVNIESAVTYLPERGTIEYNNLIRANRNDQRRQHLQLILDAVSAYARDKGRLPSEIPTDGYMEMCPSWDFCYGGVNLEVLADGYLKDIPMDPLLKDRTGYLIRQESDGSIFLSAPLAELKEEIFLTTKLGTTNESNRTFLKFAPDQRSSHMQRYEELLEMRQEQTGAVQMNFATKLPGIRVERPSRRMMQEEKKSDGIVRTLWFSTGGQMWRTDE